MPKQKGLKRVTRSRMAETGEPRTAARARVLDEPPRSARAAAAEVRRFWGERLVALAALLAAR